jgi:hypothetical protein
MVRVARPAILFVLFVGGCHAHPPVSGAYGAELPLNAGETVSFEDGLEVRVEDVQTACQPPLVCAQRGEIQVTLRVTSAGAPGEVQLSEHQHTEESLGLYTFRYVSKNGEPRLTVERGGRDASASPTASTAGRRHLFGPYGTELTLAAGDTATFEDGLQVRVAEIVDARCPPTVVCAWAGEIEVILRVTNEGAPGEVRLGAVTRPEDSLGPNTFRLSPEKVTPSEVALTVRKGQSDAHRG